MLEAINVSKSFDGRPVIRHFSARLEPGGHYCLMGPSGSGKTTLLRLLMGLLKPDEGKVVHSAELRLSAVFQEDRLLPQLSAMGNVALVCASEAAEIRRKLCALGLDAESLDQPVSTFSGGMRRRVALCRALMAEYDVLLMDEPYKGLDEETKRRVMAVVAEETQDKTVLLVTHDREEAASYTPLTLS